MIKCAMQVVKQVGLFTLEEVTKKVKTGEEIRLKLISAADPEKRIKILLKKDSKINKAKKKFGKRYNVLKKTLKLVHCGVELTGDEIACQVEGEEIIVHEGV